MTKPEIEAAVAAVFPFQKDGKPAYRSNQDRLCVEAVDAITNAGYRAVAVDAPVGSGKSAINYAVAKICGRAVYVTAQKQLQDQLDDDDLPGVRSVKGRNAYRCNLAAAQDHPEADCALRNHRQLPFKTCRNSSIQGYRPIAAAVDQILTWVSRTLADGKGLSKHELRRQTSFRSVAEAREILESCADANSLRTKEEIFIKGCGCVVEPMECPVRSARFVAHNFADVAVLNPDAYYLLKKVSGYFSDRKIMICDEAHRLDGAVQRMFRIEIPVPAFENATGISLCDVVDHDESDKVAELMLEILNQRLLPLLAAGTVLEREAEKAERSLAGAEAVLNAAAAAFSDPENGSEWRNQYCLVCEGFGIEPVSVRLMGMFPGLNAQEVVRHVVALKETLVDDAVVLKLMLGLRHGESRVFIKEQKQVPAGAVAAAYVNIIDADMFASAAEEITVMEFVPMHIGAILQKLFFNGIDSIILSSGTWPEAKAMLRDYGFTSGKIQYLRADPVFPAKNRPVFVCNQIDWTDFSEKVYGGKGYVYQTPDGANKFCQELDSVIKSIRTRHGANTNIAVHTFSHAVAGLVAEYMVGADASTLMHVEKRIRNHRNGHVFEKADKEALVQRFCKNPGTGLTLISPSIGEGLDFKYDICRAQIILKAPIPNLGDTYVNKKFNGCAEIGLPPNRSFLDRLCAIDLNQIYGRVVRAEDDWGETYVMDMALAKRLANAFEVTIPGFDGRVPGSMKKLNLEYFKQGVRCSSDGYTRKFVWPV